MPEQYRQEELEGWHPHELVILKNLLARAEEIQADLLSRNLPADDLIFRSAATEAFVEALIAENQELRAWFRDQALLLQKMMHHPLPVDEQEIKKLIAKGVAIGEHKDKIRSVLLGIELEQAGRNRALSEGRKKGTDKGKEKAKPVHARIQKMNADLLARPANEGWTLDARANHIAEKVNRKESYVRKLIAEPRKTKQA